MQPAGATRPDRRATRHVRTVTAIALALLSGLIAAACSDDTPAADPVAPSVAATALVTTPDEPAASPTTGASEVTDDAPCSVTYEIEGTFPHDPAAFTQGLVVDGDVLHESTGLVGESTVRTVDPTTGEVLRSTPLPAEQFGEGLALLGDRLFQLTWRNEVVHVYDRTLTLLETVPVTGEGWGLTADGDELVLSNGSPMLSWIEPGTWTTTRSVTVTDRGTPVASLNELEAVDGAVLANVWQLPTIAVVDPTDGAVTGWLDLTALVPGADELTDPSNDVLNGIALDPATGHLYVTGKRWPVLYELSVDRSCWPSAEVAAP